ncbi:MAG TPA: DUF4383 domain-containing protein [Pseudonocardiaceae bacterium]|jgi:hypothetical protein|nr:DUF4383 domain-containing protein [Pseudonocardiaceae bacterium]
MTVDPENKFGIKIQSRGRGRTLEQNFAVLAGLVYVTIGVLGFFWTGLFANFTEMTNEALFGIFLINPFHNIVHIAVGGLWLAAAFVLTPAGTEGVNFAIGGFYLLAAVLGFLGYLSLVSIPSGNDADNWLHLLSGLAAVVFGSGILSAMGAGSRDRVNA